VETYDPAAVAAAPTARPSASGSGTLVHGARVGRYVVLSVIGRGGMGVVYAAHDPQLDRQVALKLIRTAEHPEEAERLVREAQALAKLSDPHVVAVHDAGEVDGQVFVAMHLVDGEDLATALQKRRRSEDFGQVLAWFRDAGRGLAAAHAARLVHRDFKPSNVLIDKRGRASVTDFGIAREQGRSQDPERRALSSANKLMGTPAYMAPEQHALDRATEASDQFAFCVSLWEALFDQHPFVADRSSTSSVEIGIAIFEGKLIPPRRKGRVPRRVIDALERGLSRDPARRWPSMTALVAELEPVRRTRWRWWPAAAGGAVAAGAAALALWTMRGGDAVTCDFHARVAAAWTEPMHAAVRRAISLSSTQPYRDQVASTLLARLDDVAARLHTDAGSACAARSAGDATAAAALASCVAERTDELTGFVAGLDASTPAFADDALDIERYFEPLLPCSPRADPMAVADADVAAADGLATQIGTALGHAAAGDEATAERDLEAVAVRAHRGHLPALEARARFLNGAIALERDELTAESDLEAAATLASAHQLDELAARAWHYLLRSNVTDEAGRWAAAQGAAMRTGDRHLMALAAVYHGLVLAQVSRLDAEQVCRLYDVDGPGIDEHVRHLARICRIIAGQLDRATVEATIDADLRALAPVYGEGNPIDADAIIERGALAGDDRPGSPQFEAGIADVRLAIDMLHRRLPPQHIRLATAYDLLGQLQDRAGRPGDAAQSYRDADDALNGVAQRHPRDAAAIYLHHARTDPRVELERINRAEMLAPNADVFAMHASMAADAGRWDEAFVAAERARAAARLDDPTTASVSWALARALIGVHGDRAEARELAASARATLVKLGKQDAVAAIDAWLARMPPR
jgi:hypothetical protein